MKFISVRDLRIRPGEVWKQLAEEGELVVTSNGKPIAVLSGTSDDTLDRTIAALRRARAQVAVTRLRASAQERGVDRMAAKDIQAEIRSARRRRRRRPR